MKFIKTLLSKSKKALGFMLILGIFNSILNAGLLIFINNTIIKEPIPFFPKYDWALFIAIILASLVCSRFFQTYMIKLTNNLLFDFEIMILKKLRMASYQDFEEIGNEKIYTAINDTKVLGSIPEVFMNAFNSLIVILCCFGYLFYISPVGAGLVVVAMVLLLVFYLLRNNAIEKDLNEKRDLQNSYYQYLADMLHGFKELKMGITRSNNILSKFLVKNRVKGKDISIHTSIKYMDNELTGYYSWYIILGIVMFVLPVYFNISTEKTTAFLVTILYLIGPVAVLITLIPTYTMVKISVERLNLIEQMLDPIQDRIVPSKLANAEPFEEIRLENVTYFYNDEERNQKFYLQPVNLTIKKGEIIFITGGNGSGKSTFGNLLTGLYKPYEGSIYFNDQKIDSGQLMYYSDKIAAVFTTNYIFSENYDEFELKENTGELKAHIDMMKMQEVLHLDEERNVFDKNLSKGQQKRLAMIYALLEEKEIIILDEWAAEQDPGFRKYFYEEILPQLKEQGKTIIAITHDDEYFDRATRVIKFNFGKIVSDKSSVSDFTADIKRLIN
ncbi:cyclic peptide export ABC transporter [Flavobacterium circumlabens]|uniref:ATP-binding cassette transporter n=1 Tax=Flavobacterium circumlabens TaxID=2133765 RepID=A0A4Y7U919_9FLAO|nr:MULTISPECIES: cyclic peptide export ABC transporter [Flavobacterium]QSB29032.1 cyclic peptide export ABC transporter [Flavobacterium sp. CLA17]TCN54735.1 putative ATP-binding cassette transporter [Flavobacterium circumlabens]TEB42925.1 cyclic peptide export ABC transporter [Flavobacterium circumlabens]